MKKFFSSKKKEAVQTDTELTGAQVVSKRIIKPEVQAAMNKVHIEEAIRAHLAKSSKKTSEKAKMQNLLSKMALDYLGTPTSFGKANLKKALGSYSDYTLSAAKAGTLRYEVQRAINCFPAEALAVNDAKLVSILTQGIQMEQKGPL